MLHREVRHGEHIGWMRAAVLGTNDGLISTSSLVVGGPLDPAGARS